MIDDTSFGRPSRSYKIDVKIKDKDYSNYLERVRIASTLASAYPNVELFIKVAPTDIIVNKLYGEDPIKLTISLLGEGEIPMDTFEFDLMMITSEFELPVTVEMSTGLQMDRSVIKLLTVPRGPFKTTTVLVNKIFGVTKIPKIPVDMVSELVSEYAKDAKLEIDDDGKNKEPVEQSIIPPITLFKAIERIDSQYGLYEGVPVIFCRYDNTIHVMNLTSRMKKAQTITVYHLSLTGDNLDIIDKSTDGKTFYTTDNVYTSFVGNTKFSVLGNTIKYIVAPSDTLTHTIEHDLSSICEDYGIIDSNKKIPVDSNTVDRTRYYTEFGGVEKTESFSKSMLAKKIYDLSRISFLIERHLKIENLLNVGDIIKFVPKTMEYKPLEGKYILFSSDLTWLKRGQWETTARLELVRTNKTIN